MVGCLINLWYSGNKSKIDIYDLSCCLWCRRCIIIFNKNKSFRVDTPPSQHRTPSYIVFIDMVCFVFLHSQGYKMVSDKELMEYWPSVGAQHYQQKQSGIFWYRSLIKKLIISQYGWKETPRQCVNRPTLTWEDIWYQSNQPTVVLIMKVLH